MRLFFRILLIIAVGLSVYLCVDSILRPIHFNREKDIRFNAVIGRLIDIRKAQVEFVLSRLYANISILIGLKHGYIPFG